MSNSVHERIMLLQIYCAKYFAGVVPFPNHHLSAFKILSDITLKRSFKETLQRRTGFRGKLVYFYITLDEHRLLRARALPIK